MSLFDQPPPYSMCRCLLVFKDGRRPIGEKRAVDEIETRALLARIYGCPLRILDDVVRYRLARLDE